MANAALRASMQAFAASQLAAMPESKRAALILQNGPPTTMAVATVKRITWPSRYA